ncbi:MAG: metalloregulator ArsR/SmtB family transcription factor [Chloroflexota bacterium]|nr:metalloregulator ArsR/SmtB family transcription factor [Chloroflexota bacterium]
MTDVNQDPRSERLEQAREALLDETTSMDLAQVFKILADPTRVRLISLLAGQELFVGELAGVLDMTLSAVSHHLRLLRQLHLVKARRRGRHVYYSLDDDCVKDMYRLGLEHVRHV